MADEISLKWKFYFLKGGVGTFLAAFLKCMKLQRTVITAASSTHPGRGAAATNAVPMADAVYVQASAQLVVRAHAFYASCLTVFSLSLSFLIFTNALFIYFPYVLCFCLSL